MDRLEFYRRLKEAHGDVAKLIDRAETHRAKLRATSFRATPRRLAFLAGLTRERLSR